MPNKPPPIIVDSSLSRKYLELLKRLVPGEIIYVNDNNNGHNTRSDMSDKEIMDLQKRLGAIIITQNGKDFDCENVISLKSKKSAKILINQTLYHLHHEPELSNYYRRLNLPHSLK